MIKIIIEWSTGVVLLRSLPLPDVYIGHINDKSVLSQNIRDMQSALNKLQKAIEHDILQDIIQGYITP